MNGRRNPILIGQAEVIDLVQPQVRAMLENEGIYIGGDSKVPHMVVPLASQDGKVFSMVIDEELDPERFLGTLTLHGPYLARPPAGTPADLVRELRECIAHEYMDLRARQRLSEIADKLSAAATTPAHPQACPMASRCDCLGACKHGFAGNGAEPA